MLRFSFLFLVFVSACSSSKKVSVQPGAPGAPKAVVVTASPLEIVKASKDAAALVARPVTSLGDNRAPKFSADGSHLLFLSSARPSHRQAQVYELDVLRMTERRVTFHDGDDEGASWAGPSRIVYSSVTDEIKENVSLDRIKAAYEASKSVAENPNGIRPAPRVINGGDIYMQRLDGREIERLTDVAGPDVSPTSDGKRVVFVSSRTGDPRLFMWNSSGAVRPISHGPDLSPAFSPDGRALVWQRTVSGGSQLMMSENLREAVPLTAPGSADVSPQWNGKSDAVVFASNRGGKGTDLYLIDRKASCLKRLTEVQGELSYPALSPDGSKIAFVARSGGQYQIYLMDDRSASLPCMPSVTAKP